MIDLILNDKVVNLRAWQLYLGNGIFTFAVGITLMLIASLFNMFGLNNGAINNILKAAGTISGARVPHQEQAVSGFRQRRMS
jgi:hypothetical protein